MIMVEPTSIELSWLTFLFPTEHGLMGLCLLQYQKAPSPRLKLLANQVTKFECDWPFFAIKLRQKWATTESPVPKSGATGAVR